MSPELKRRTPEQVTKKMLNEERTIINLELAIKKARFRKTVPENNDYNWRVTNV